MTRTKRPLIGIIIAFLLLVLFVSLVWFVPPNLWLIEILAIGTLTGGLGLLGSWLTGRKKYGVMASLFIVLTLIMNRLGILNWITLGLWLAVAGLITLLT